MNSGVPAPVIPAVLPATASVALFPMLQSNAELVTAVLAVAALWAVSFVGINSAVRFIKK